MSGFERIWDSLLLFGILKSKSYFSFVSLDRLKFLIVNFEPQEPQGQKARIFAYF